MHLIHKIDASVLLAELVFGIHEYEALLCSDLRSPLEYGPGIFLELFVILGGNEAGSYDVLLGNVLVVTLGGLGGRSDDRLREFLVLDHTVRHRDTADFTLSRLVLPPGMS